jgi:hypothetical protein
MAQTREWPPEVQAQLNELSVIAQQLDQHSAAIDDLYQRRVRLFEALRKADVPFRALGDASGTNEAAVRVAISKERKRRTEAGDADPADTPPRRAPRR